MAYHVEVHFDEHHTGLIVFNRTTNRHLHVINAGNSPASYLTVEEYKTALAMLHAAHRRDRNHQFVMIVWYTTLERWKEDLAAAHPEDVTLLMNPITDLRTDPD